MFSCSSSHAEPNIHALLNPKGALLYHLGFRLRPDLEHIRWPLPMVQESLADRLLFQDLISKLVPQPQLLVAAGFPTILN